MEPAEGSEETTAIEFGIELANIFASSDLPSKISEILQLIDSKMGVLLWGNIDKEKLRENQLEIKALETKAIPIKIFNPLVDFFEHFQDIEDFDVTLHIKVEKLETEQTVGGDIIAIVCKCEKIRYILRSPKESYVIPSLWYEGSIVQVENWICLAPIDISVNFQNITSAKATTRIYTDLGAIIKENLQTCVNYCVALLNSGGGKIYLGLESQHEGKAKAVGYKFTNQYLHIYIKAFFKQIEKCVQNIAPALRCRNIYENFIEIGDQIVVSTEKLKGSNDRYIFCIKIPRTDQPCYFRLFEKPKIRKDDNTMEMMIPETFQRLQRMLSTCTIEDMNSAKNELVCNKVASVQLWSRDSDRESEKFDRKIMHFYDKESQRLYSRKSLEERLVILYIKHIIAFWNLHAETKGSVKCTLRLGSADTKHTKTHPMWIGAAIDYKSIIANLQNKIYQCWPRLPPTYISIDYRKVLFPKEIRSHIVCGIEFRSMDEKDINTIVEEWKLDLLTDSCINSYVPVLLPLKNNPLLFALAVKKPLGRNNIDETKFVLKKKCGNAIDIVDIPETLNLKPFYAIDIISVISKHDKIFFENAPVAYSVTPTSELGILNLETIVRRFSSPDSYKELFLDFLESSFKIDDNEKYMLILSPGISIDDLRGNLSDSNIDVAINEIMDAPWTCICTFGDDNLIDAFRKYAQANNKSIELISKETSSIESASVIWINEDHETNFNFLLRQRRLFDKRWSIICLWDIFKEKQLKFLKHIEEGKILIFDTVKTSSVQCKYLEHLNPIIIYNSAFYLSRWLGEIKHRGGEKLGWIFKNGEKVQLDAFTTSLMKDNWLLIDRIGWEKKKVWTNAETLKQEIIAFYHGYEDCNFKTIYQTQDQYVILRECYSEIRELIFQHFKQNNILHHQLYIIKIKGKEGIGGSMLLRQMAVDFAQNMDYPILWMQKKTSSCHDLVSQLNRVTGKVVFFFVDFIDNYNLDSLISDFAKNESNYPTAVFVHLTHKPAKSASCNLERMKKFREEVWSINGGELRVPVKTWTIDLSPSLTLNEKVSLISKLDTLFRPLKIEGEHLFMIVFPYIIQNADDTMINIGLTAFIKRWWDGIEDNIIKEMLKYIAIFQIYFKCESQAILKFIFNTILKINNPDEILRNSIVVGSLLKKSEFKFAHWIVAKSLLCVDLVEPKDWTKMIIKIIENIGKTDFNSDDTKLLENTLFVERSFIKKRSSFGLSPLMYKAVVKKIQQRVKLKSVNGEKIFEKLYEIYKGKDDRLSYLTANYGLYHIHVKKDKKTARLCVQKAVNLSCDKFEKIHSKVLSLIDFIQIDVREKLQLEQETPESNWSGCNPVIIHIVGEVEREIIKQYRVKSERNTLDELKSIFGDFTDFAEAACKGIKCFKFCQNHSISIQYASTSLSLHSFDILRVGFTIQKLCVDNFEALNSLMVTCVENIIDTKQDWPKRWPKFKKASLEKELIDHLSWVKLGKKVTNVSPSNDIRIQTISLLEKKDGITKNDFVQLINHWKATAFSINGSKFRPEDDDIGLFMKLVLGGIQKFRNLDDSDFRKQIRNMLSLCEQEHHLPNCFFWLFVLEFLYGLEIEGRGFMESANNFTEYSKTRKVNKITSTRHRFMIENTKEKGSLLSLVDKFGIYNVSTYLNSKKPMRFQAKPLKRNYVKLYDDRLKNLSHNFAVLRCVLPQIAEKSKTKVFVALELNDKGVQAHCVLQQITNSP